jgi:hypothetical protein
MISAALFNNDKKPVLLNDTRNRLKRLFTNDVNSLAKMLDKEFSRWTKLD